MVQVENLRPAPGWVLEVTSIPCKSESISATMARSRGHKDHVFAQVRLSEHTGRIPLCLRANQQSKQYAGVVREVRATG